MTDMLQSLVGLSVVQISLDPESAGILFDDKTTLGIYNVFYIRGIASPSSKDFLGRKVVSVQHGLKKIEIKFDNNAIIEVDLSDKGYTGPESMELIIKGKTIVVVN